MLNDYDASADLYWFLEHPQEVKFDWECYIETPTARMVMNHAERGIEDRDCELIIGPPQIGKSAALQYMAVMNPRLRYIEVGFAGSSVKSLLEAVGDVFDIAVRSKWLKDSEDALLEGLRQRRSGCCLIIDEFQNLQGTAQRTALGLFDKAGLPIIAAGNPQVLKRTRSAESAFEQIMKRFGRPLVLKRIARNDVAAFGAAYGVEGGDAIDLLVRFGVDEQNLKQVKRLLNSAALVAGVGRPIRFSHLKDALARLCGPVEARRLIKQPEVKVA